MGRATGTGQCACGKTISANKLACGVCAAAKPRPEPTGCLEILNVQGGDIKITFDKDNATETIRAKRIVQDMLRRGYCLVVEVERNGVKAYERVREFDEKTAEYVIADFDSLEAAKADAAQPVPPDATEPPAAGLCDCGKPLHHRGRCQGKAQARHEKRLPMEGTRATAIGRSAGG